MQVTDSMDSHLRGNDEFWSFARTSFVLFFSLVFFVFNPIAHAAEKTHPAELTPSEDQEVIYACPIHPDEISDEPGSCSLCGMFLVVQEKHEHDRHNVHHGLHSHALPESAG